MTFIQDHFRFIIIILLIFIILFIIFFVLTLTKIDEENQKYYENYRIKDNLIVNKYNLHNYLTACIKTFLRPHTLYENLSSITKKYPNIKILVADDSSDKVKSLNKNIIKKFHNVTIIDLPYDSGLSKGRNEIVKKVKTKYTFICDDSRILNDKSDLAAMVNFLEYTNYDLIGGFLKNRESFNGLYRKEGISKSGKIIISVHNKNILNKNNSISNPYLKAYNANQVLNVFVAKTSSLLESPWHNQCKVGEHEKFFYDFWIKNKKVAYSPEMIFSQCKNKKYLDGGEKLRKRSSFGLKTPFGNNCYKGDFKLLWD